jgi:tetraacyldisaccharide 4'-kinase
MLRAHGIEVRGHPLPDHARIKAADISFGDGRPVLMTEKDAVKCAQIAGAHHWYVPVSASFAAAECATILATVISAIDERGARARG